MTDTVDLPNIQISDYILTKDGNNFCVKCGDIIVFTIDRADLFHGLPRSILKGDLRGFSKTAEYSLFRSIRTRLRKDWFEKNNYNYVSNLINYINDSNSALSKRRELRYKLNIVKANKDYSRVKKIKKQFAEIESEPEMHVNARKAYYGMNSAALLFTNRVLKFLVNQVNPAILALVRRFPIRCRKAIYNFIIKDPRYFQFTESFPMFGLFLSDFNLSSDLSSTDRNALKERILAGEKIKTLCQVANFPIEFRKIKPQCGSVFLTYKDHFKNLQERYSDTFYHLIPKKTMQQYRWLSLMEDTSYRVLTPHLKYDWFHWVAYSSLKDHKGKPLLNLNIHSLRSDYQLFYDAFIVEPWGLKVDFDGAMKRQEDWHRRERERVLRVQAQRAAAQLFLLERQREEISIKNAELEALLKKPFPEPFLPGYANNEWEIVPLLCKEDLEEEGLKMHHCVGSYTPEAIRGKSYFYSLKKDNERLATLELSPKYKIKQLRGHFNRHPGEEAFSFVRSWISKMIGEKYKNGREIISIAV